MPNTELTLDQLKVAAGGVQMGPDGKGCTERDFSPYGDIFKNIKWPMPQRPNGSDLSAPSEGVSMYDH